MFSEINILIFAFLENLPSRCSMEWSQSSKNCRSTLRSQENLGSSIKENGMREGFKSNLREFLSLMFILSKKASIIEQNFALSAATGEA